MVLNKDNTAEYIRARHLLPASPGGNYSVETLGGGFLNTVLRIRSGEQSIIVKQALDALRLFPDLRVSTDRIVYERRALETLHRLFPDGVTPPVLYFDDDHRVLVMGDLGGGPLLERMLIDGHVALDTAERLGAFLAELHRRTRNDGALRRTFDNEMMQQLRLQYCFYFLKEPALLDAARRLGRLFTAEKLVLLHGDFWTASVMADGPEVRVFDLEFAYYGHPAQDVGFMMAHYLLHAYNTPRVADSIYAAVRGFWETYAAEMGEALPEGTGAVAMRQAGIEMLFRIDGINRVKYITDDGVKKRIRTAAERFVLDDRTTVERMMR